MNTYVNPITGTVHKIATLGWDPPLFSRETESGLATYAVNVGEGHTDAMEHLAIGLSQITGMPIAWVDRNGIGYFLLKK